MSNSLVIAAVTTTLRHILDSAITANTIDPVAGANVTHVAPDSAALPDRGINIFLYRVEPDATWRNLDLPTRRSDGSLAQRPCAALSLHYALSFYGDDSLHEPQRLLTIATRTLHAQPVLSPHLVTACIDATVAAAAELAVLAQADLAEQVEAVRITPETMNLEESSKLWSFLFPTGYVLTVPYQCGVVLVETDATPAVSMPVRARGVYTVASAPPVLDEVVSASGRFAPIVAASDVELRGSRLTGDVTRVRVGGELITPATDAMSAERITLALPATLSAGVLGAQVVHELDMGDPPTPHRGTESNVAAFVLRPQITNVATNPVGPNNYDITVTVTPEVGEGQRAVVLLNENAAPADRRAHAFSISAPSRTAAGNDITVRGTGIPDGNWFVRVMVDGAESEGHETVDLP